MCKCMFCAWLCPEIRIWHYTGLSTSRGTGLHAGQPPRWPVGRWGAPQADRWSLAEGQDAQMGQR